MLHTSAIHPRRAQTDLSLQATADGKAEVTINRTYRDDNGTYANSGSGSSVALSFDTSNPGRAVFLMDGGPVSLYFFNTNEAIEIGVSNGSIEKGWLEAQTQTQTSFTSTSIAGRYMVGELPLLSSTQNGSTGEFILATNNLISGSLTTAGQGVLTSDAPVNMSYTWDPVAPDTGTFTLSGSLGNGSSSCAVISSTKFVCTPQSCPSRYVMIMQQ